MKDDEIIKYLNYFCEVFLKILHLNSFGKYFSNESFINFIEVLRTINYCHLKLININCSLCFALNYILIIRTFFLLFNKRCSSVLIFETKFYHLFRN